MLFIWDVDLYKCDDSFSLGIGKAILKCRRTNLLKVLNASHALKCVVSQIKISRYLSTNEIRTICYCSSKLEVYLF